MWRDKGAKTDFGARRNVRSTEDMEPVAVLCYATASIREQDYDFAERSDFKLSLKVRTPRLAAVTPGLLATVGETLFDVSHTDTSGLEMFLYLEEVGRVELS